MPYAAMPMLPGDLWRCFARESKPPHPPGMLVAFVRPAVLGKIYLPRLSASSGDIALDVGSVRRSLVRGNGPHTRCEYASPPAQARAEQAFTPLFTQVARVLNLSARRRESILEAMPENSLRWNRLRRGLERQLNNAFEIDGRGDCGARRLDRARRCRLVPLPGDRLPRGT